MKSFSLRHLRPTLDLTKAPSLCGGKARLFAVGAGMVLGIADNMDLIWEQLQSMALEEVEATLDELPVPLQEKARALPVTFYRRPSPELVADGIEPDTLGLFTGSEFVFEETSPVPLPPQIMLFLENLWEFADQDEDIFMDEVHTTYLHELGHYLGLDEDDLSDRGLE